MANCLPEIAHLLSLKQHRNFTLSIHAFSKEWTGKIFVIRAISINFPNDWARKIPAICPFARIHPLAILVLNAQNYDGTVFFGSIWF